MSKIIHIVNGDVTAATLTKAELPGEIAVWADGLDQGPLHADPAKHRAARAEFLAGWTGRPTDAIAAELAAWDAAVDGAADADEVVLWYEHDVFDQLALVRLIAQIAGKNPKATMSMVSIDAHAEIPVFKGLGELAPDQLAGLWPRRIPVGQDAIDEATAAWSALTGTDPRAVVFVARRARALPYLGAALSRWLEDFPATSSGLSRTEDDVLRAIGSGQRSTEAVVSALQGSDRTYLVTDQVIETTCKGLAKVGALSGAFSDSGSAAIAVTALGEDLRAAKQDRVALGIDVWRGGVHLVGPGPLWRWDAKARRPVYA